MKRDRNKKKTWRGRLIKWALWVVGTILILAGVLLLITQTRPFKNWARDYAVGKVNESIAGQLHVGRLDGNFLSHVELTDISLSLETDTVIRVSSIRVRYDLWTLLEGVIRIDSLLIDSPYIKLNQSSDSAWNLTRLASADTAADLTADTTAAEFGYDIELHDLQVLAASASIRALDSMIPARVDDCDIQLSARYSPDQLYLSMRKFRMQALRPDIQIRNLTFEALVDSVSVAVKDMLLETAGNRFEASANIYLNDPRRSTADLIADSVDCLEFGTFLPSFLVSLKPVADLRATLDGDSLVAGVNVVSGRQTVDLIASLRSVSTLLDTSAQHPLAYTANLNMKRVAVARWLDNPDVDVVLNGSIALEGSGTEPEILTANIKSNLNNCLIRGRPVSALSIDAGYTAGNADVRARAVGPFGKMTLNANLRDVLNSLSYTGKIRLENFDVGKLGFDDSLKTDLNLTASVDGTGISLDSARGQMQLAIAASSAQDLQIDRGFVSVKYGGDGLRIDTMFLATSAVTADIAGDVGWNKTGSLRYTVNLLDGSTLTGLTNSMLLGGTGLITGDVSGTPDSMTTRFSLDFYDLLLTGAGLAELHGEITATYVDSAVSASGWVKGRQISTDAMTLDSLFASGAYKDDGADLSIALYSPNGLQSSCELVVTLDSLVHVILERLTLDYNGTQWVGGSDSTAVTVDDSVYTVGNLRLTSRAADGSLQSISLHGIVSLVGQSDIGVTIDNLALEPIASLFDIEFGARLVADFNLSGMADNPDLRGKVTLSDGRYQGYQFDRLAGDLDYSDGLATFVLNIKPTIRDSLTVGGSVPFAFSLADSSDVVAEDRTMDVRILADRLPLDVLKAAGYSVERAGGHINLDLSVTNTLEDPHVAGSVHIRDGNISMPEYGVDYQDIEAAVSLKPREVVLDSLVVQENKGRLRVAGTVTFDSSLISGDISASRVSLIAKDFYAVRHRHYEVQVSSDIGLSGTAQEPTYSGTLTVNRSRFYLPAFVGQSDADALDDMSLPMLATATGRDTAGVIDSIRGPAAASLNGDSTQSAFLENLRGNLKITIPKNTWITSPDLKLELAGDVEVVKEGSDFELFGNIRVVRGHYQLYGKRFTVKRGSLLFQGGSDYIAILDIEAAYVFRTAAREKKTLRLYVEGTSEVPLLRFTLDDAELLEGDAVSYILFGRSLDELTQGQRSAVSDGMGSEEMAGKVAAGLLAGQLSKALGDKLNLDVIEIKAQGDLQSAAVVIGKYLTPDLFMSYQRSFGSVTDDDLEPEKVTLEYQLTRLIYLQLTEGDAEDAGFDVIFKLQSK